jgi:hypothetical protein
MDWSGQGNCLECTQVNVGLLVGIILVLIVYAVFYHISAQISSGTFRVLVYFLQALWLTIYPVSRVRFLSELSLHLGNPSTSSCPFPMSPFGRIFMTTFYPVIVLVLMVLLASVMRIPVIYDSFCRLVARVFDKWIQKRSSKQVGSSSFGSGSLFVPEVPGSPTGAGGHGPSHAVGRIRAKYQGRVLSFLSRDAFLRSCMQLLLSSFQVLANGSFFYFSCEKVAGHNIMLIHPEVECNTEEYEIWLLLYIPLCIFVCGMVVVFPWLLWYFIYKRQHVPPILMVAMEPYRSGRTWFWECWLLLRRLALTVCFLVFLRESDLNLRRISLGIVHSVSLALHQIVLPYKRRYMNIMEGISLCCLVIASFCVGTDDQRSRNLWGWTTVMLFVVGMTLCVIAGKIYFTTRRVRRSLKGRTAFISGRSAVDMDSMYPGSEERATLSFPAGNHNSFSSLEQDLLDDH